jgi:hypothetical protein
MQGPQNQRPSASSPIRKRISSKQRRTSDGRIKKRNRQGPTLGPRGRQRRRPSANSPTRRCRDRQPKSKSRLVKARQKTNRVSAGGCEDCLDISQPIPKIPKREVRSTVAHFSGHHGVIAENGWSSANPGH